MLHSPPTHTGPHRWQLVFLESGSSLNNTVCRESSEYINLHWLHLVRCRSWCTFVKIRTDYANNRNHPTNLFVACSLFCLFACVVYFGLLFWTVGCLFICLFVFRFPPVILVRCLFVCLCVFTPICMHSALTELSNCRIWAVRYSVWCDLQSPIRLSLDQIYRSSPRETVRHICRNSIICGV